MIKCIQPIHFLIAEDEFEIHEVFALLLSSRFTVRFTQVTGAAAAIEALKASSGDIDFVISDFNMPGGNGKVVFDWVQTHVKNLPFLLSTSDLRSNHTYLQENPLSGFLPKPFDDIQLFQEVERLIHLTNINPERDPEYVPVSVVTLRKIGEISKPLYIRLGEDKYLKIVNENTQFTDADLQRFRLKNTTHLYSAKGDFFELIMKFKKRVLTEMIYSNGDSDAKLELSTSIQEVIVGAIKVFGWSKETQELANKNIHLVKRIMDSKPVLREAFDWAAKSDQDYGFVHSIMLCYMTAALVKDVGLTMEHAVENLAFASFFHDIALDSNQIKNEDRFIKAMEMNILINRKDVDAIAVHTEKSAEMVSSWPSCPEAVLTILRQHHERPDGSGFPRRLTAGQIDELSACFIVSENFTKLYLDHKEKQSVLNGIPDLSNYFQPSPFRKYFDSAAHYFIAN